MIKDAHRWHWARWAMIAFFALWLAGCRDVTSPPVVKIGLIAPFEGPSRPLGYQVLDGVKLRLHQWNDGHHAPKVELVALNDDGDPQLAATLPAQLAQDPDIRVILGPPQGHTAMAALPALAKTGIPTLLLAPVSSVPPQGGIVPYAGLGEDYQQLFQPLVGTLQPAWFLPVQGPVLWLGDPLSLAELAQNHPEWVPAAGPVAGEAVLQGWAPDLAQRILWAAPQPHDLPSDFAARYRDLTGRDPTWAAALAYAATDQALQLIAQAPDDVPGPASLAQVPVPALVIIHGSQ